MKASKMIRNYEECQKFESMLEWLKKEMINAKSSYKKEISP